MNAIFISTSAFDDYGGWVLDTQFITNIGASYLLAHGLGKKVRDAVKKIYVEESGKYKIWAYTKDWVAHWKQNAAPGLFKIKINKWQSDILGDEDKEWHWQEAGICDIEQGEASISLNDLTGFEGRCAAILLTADINFVPESGETEFVNLRDTLCGRQVPENAGDFDIVVAGGGIAGMSAAVTAAKNNLKVALIQDRLVLGGNNSSEVRVWLSGETNFEPFKKIGDITRLFEPEKHAHYGPSNTGDLYEDDNRIAIIKSFPNISLFLGCFLKEARVDENNIIKSVTCIDVKTYAEKIFKANLFVDATGDATLGYTAGADYEITTNGHMGMTNVWHIEKAETEQEFPRCPWAIDLSNVNFPGRKTEKDPYDRDVQSGPESLGGWYWESGMEYNPIKKAEYARDTNFRAMYGAVDCIKNTDGNYKNYYLKFAAYIGGKRESRRLLGDIILTKSDVLENHEFDDRCVPSSWLVDVHYPDRKYYPAFHEGDAFIAEAYMEKFPVNPYWVPYRCLYSRNIKNLFMAGRDVSVSHDALGTVRVMRTGGMMGEVVGYAAGLCKKYGALPRDIYTNHLEEFINLLK